MSVRLNPYLGFRGNAREAITFYQSVFGGDLALSTFGDFQSSQDPEEVNLVVHSMLTTDGGITLMASDTPNRMSYNPGDNFSISLSGPQSDEPELRGYWEKLIDGGTITMPLEKAIWGDTFGMCVDKFGIAWLINIAGAPS
jgi:PhnB protein